jgi:hypothetical protein
VDLRSRITCSYGRPNRKKTRENRRDAETQRRKEGTGKRKGDKGIGGDREIKKHKKPLRKPGIHEKVILSRRQINRGLRGLNRMENENHLLSVSIGAIGGFLFLALCGLLVQKGSCKAC